MIRTESGFKMGPLTCFLVLTAVTYAGAMSEDERLELR